MAKRHTITRHSHWLTTPHIIVGGRFDFIAPSPSQIVLDAITPSGRASGKLHSDYPATITIRIDADRKWVGDQ